MVGRRATHYRHSPVGLRDVFTDMQAGCRRAGSAARGHELESNYLKGWAAIERRQQTAATRRVGRMYRWNPDSADAAGNWMPEFVAMAGAAISLGRRPAFAPPWMKFEELAAQIPT